MKNPSLWLSSGEGIHPMSWLSQDCSKTATWLPSPGTLKGHSGTVGQCGRKWRHWAWQVHTITPPQTSTSAEGVDLNCPLLLREWNFGKGPQKVDAHGLVRFSAQDWFIKTGREVYFIWSTEKKKCQGKWGIKDIPTNEQDKSAEMNSNEIKFYDLLSRKSKTALGMMLNRYLNKWGCLISDCETPKL